MAWISIKDSGRFYCQIISQQSYLFSVRAGNWHALS